MGLRILVSADTATRGRPQDERRSAAQRSAAMPLARACSSRLQRSNGTVGGAGAQLRQARSPNEAYSEVDDVQCSVGCKLGTISSPSRVLASCAAISSLSCGGVVPIAGCGAALGCAAAADLPLCSTSDSELLLTLSTSGQCRRHLDVTCMVSLSHSDSVTVRLPATQPVTAARL